MGIKQRKLLQNEQERSGHIFKLSKRNRHLEMVKMKSHDMSAYEDAM